MWRFDVFLEMDLDEAIFYQVIQYSIKFSRRFNISQVEGRHEISGELVLIN